MVSTMWFAIDKIADLTVNDDEHWLCETDISVWIKGFDLFWQLQIYHAILAQLIKQISIVFKIKKHLVNCK